VIPGLGPIVAAGPLAARIVAGFEGAAAVGGASLVSIGIPKYSVHKYDTALKTDKYLLAVHGTAHEVAKARDIIGGTTHDPYAVDGHGHDDLGTADPFDVSYGAAENRNGVARLNVSETQPEERFPIRRK
jgi:hypothetical protein